jgi:hypothetical protein
LKRKEGATGAVTLIQRFGSALNLNIHFHILFLDGVYAYRDNRPPRFQRVKAPDKSELEGLVQLISQRVSRCLERQGLLEQDAENAWLNIDPADDTDAMPYLLGSSVSYRIAVGPQQGQKAFMIRTIRPLDRPDPGLERVAKANGFSLHAGVSCEGHQRDKRERLCRYIARPAVAIPRLSLSRIHPEDALPGRYNPGGVRAGGFHGSIGGFGAKAQSQPHPLPRGPGTQSPLARVGHTGQAWQGDEDGNKCGSKDTGRVSCGDDLGSAHEASLQY